MKRAVWVVLASLATSCGGATAPPRSGDDGTGEIELGRAVPEPPAWPVGLRPCAKDAPPESCAARPPHPTPNGAPRPAEDDATVWKVPVDDRDPVRGPADALVTVVVFSDFECPFCKRAGPVFDKLLGDEPREVRLVWKDYPLPMHEHAETAAVIARMARELKGDAGFFRAHDLLYAAQPLEDAALREVARALDLGWGAVSSAIRSARFGAVLRADVALGDRVDVQATPTTFVNGRKLVGAQPYERVRALVDEELAKARRLVESGVPRGALYAHVIAEGKQVSPPSDVPESG
jgi:protein-disulfide isomerase